MLNWASVLTVMVPIDGAVIALVEAQVVVMMLRIVPPALTPGRLPKAS